MKAIASQYEEIPLFSLADWMKDSDLQAEDSLTYTVIKEPFIIAQKLLF